MFLKQNFGKESTLYHIQINIWLGDEVLQLKLSVFMKVERHSKYLVDSSSSAGYGKFNADFSFAYYMLNLQYLWQLKKILNAIPKCLVEKQMYC